MNIEKEMIGTLEASIRVDIGQADYLEQVNKALKDLQKKAQMPGFRPGKVPMGVVKKMYGKSVLAEEVTKIASDALLNYLREQELSVLGQPIPDVEKTGRPDWDEQTEFSFFYHIGLAPEIDMELSDRIALDYPRIQIGKDMLDTHVEEIRKRFGKMVHPEVSEADDVLFGAFVEMQSEDQIKEGGITHEANLYIKYIKDESVQQKLTGIQAGDSLVINVPASVQSETEAAAMLGIKKEELDKHGPLFRFTLQRISRLEPAALNKELYEKVAEGKGMDTEKDFRAFVSDQLSLQYQADVDRHLKNEVMKKLIEVTNLSLPEEFLKKWMLTNHDEEISRETLDKEFDGVADSFKWQLVENHLVKKYSIEVKPEEVHAHLDAYFRAQMRQYGQHEVDQETIDHFIKNIASKEEEIKKVYEHLTGQKLLNLYKEKLKLKEVKMDLDDFVQLIKKTYPSPEAAEAPGQS